MYVSIIIFIILSFTFNSYSKENNFYGKEFVFAVPQNSFFSSDSTINIYLNIYSLYDETKIELHYKGVLVFETLLEKDKIIKIDLKQFGDIELRGKGEFSNKVFRLLSNNNISANLINYYPFTSDATSLLPLSSSGKEYTLSSLSNNFASINFIDGSRFYSFAMIIGLENNTEVEISSDSQLYDGIKDTNTIEIILNKDEVYLFTAGLESSQYDLTGTLVESNKNIIAFSGHELIQLATLALAEDLLFDQCIPDITHGTEYIVGHLHRTEEEYFPIYRIISLYDENIITVNNEEIELNKSEWKHYFLKDLSYIKSDKPIIVTKYMKSLPQFINGDPFMINLTPTQQYVSKYNYTVPKLGDFTGHYVAISCVDSTASEITLNGNKLDLRRFNRVQNTEYLYGVFRIFTDSINLVSDYDFGAFAFGVGSNVSYGINLGSNLRDIKNILLDRTPPELIINNCDYSLNIIEELEFDSGVESLEYSGENIKDISINLAGNNASLDIVPISPYYDTKISLQIADSSGNLLDTIVYFKGLTIKPELELAKKYDILRDYTRSFNMKNYGKFNQDLRLYFNMGQNINLTYSDKQVSVESDENKSLEIYIYSNESKDYKDTLYIYNDCNTLLKIPISTIFNFELDFTSRCGIQYSNYNKNDIERTEVYSLSGELLGVMSGFFQVGKLSKQSNKILILKEYHEDHYHIRKIFIQK